MPRIHKVRCMTWHLVPAVTQHNNQDFRDITSKQKSSLNPLRRVIFCPPASSAIGDVRRQHNPRPGKVISGLRYISSHGKGFRHRQTHRPHRPDRAGTLGSLQARQWSGHQSALHHRRWHCGCRGDCLSLLRRRALNAPSAQYKARRPKTAGFFLEGRANMHSSAPFH